MAGWRDSSDSTAARTSPPVSGGAARPSCGADPTMLPIRAASAYGEQGGTSRSGAFEADCRMPRRVEGGGELAFKDVVIVVPGIGGSRLRSREGRVVWDVSRRMLARALLRDALDELTILDESLEETLDDGIAADGVLSGAHVLPGLWKVDGYDPLIVGLRDRLGLLDGRNLHAFAYDWRRDNRVSAGVLRRRAEAALSAWREESGAADAKLVFVAHSMGGLVVRRYAECLGGWRHIRRLVTIGTPFGGSLNALGFLVNGLARGVAPFVADATVPLRSMASVHQLLPTYPCVDVGGDIRRVADAGLLALDAPMIADAIRFHAEMDAAAEENRRESGYDPRYIVPLASFRQPTLQSAALVGDWLTLSREAAGGLGGGDGTVPLRSAIPPGQDPRDVLYASGSHASLQTLTPVIDQIDGQLANAAMGSEPLRSTAAEGEVSFALDDVYVASRPVPLEARLSRGHEQTLAGCAEEEASGAIVETTLWPRADGAYTAEIPLRPGAWRVTISGEGATGTTDIALVMDEEAQRSG